MSTAEPPLVPFHRITVGIYSLSNSTGFSALLILEASLILSAVVVLILVLFLLKRTQFVHVNCHRIMANVIWHYFVFGVAPRYFEIVFTFYYSANWTGLNSLNMDENETFFPGSYANIVPFIIVREVRTFRREAYKVFRRLGCASYSLCAWSRGSTVSPREITEETKPSEQELSSAPHLENVMGVRLMHQNTEEETAAHFNHLENMWEYKLASFGRSQLRNTIIPLTNEKPRRTVSRNSEIYLSK
ncbi:hypothetical protein DdX_04373 [Ditylenchus destructor]|uniref:Uncharacterized protein n=1 Tax=Ditylenchus destructor TaxID=166010 RepID=A0AAD4R4G3_9BILA|nr:hypothetical protein DdX_04373 [Ditylenchus destructor]